MANVRSANVLVVDTSAAFTGPWHVCGVKYIGNTNGTAAIKGNAASNGDTLWEAEGDTNVFEDVRIYDNQGIYVEVTNGAKVYIYSAV